LFAKSIQISERLCGLNLVRVCNKFKLLSELQ